MINNEFIKASLLVIGFISIVMLATGITLYKEFNMLKNKSKSKDERIYNSGDNIKAYFCIVGNKKFYTITQDIEDGIDYYIFSINYNNGLAFTINDDGINENKLSDGYHIFKEFVNENKYVGEITISELDPYTAYLLYEEYGNFNR